MSFFNLKEQAFEVSFPQHVWGYVVEVSLGDPSDLAVEALKTKTDHLETQVHTVDASEIRRKNQLRFVVYPFIPLFTRFYLEPFQVVQDFFQQQ